MDILSYSPETGEFRWRVRRSNKCPEGALAGGLNGSGYRQIEIDGVVYQCHRLAWLFVKGVWPKEEIDHENTKRDDNWIDNLREATKSQNQHNRRRQEGSSKYKGVHFHKLTGKWGAKIQVNGKNLHLGLFEREEDAALVRIFSAAELHGEFARSA